MRRLALAALLFAPLTAAATTFRNPFDPTQCTWAGGCYVTAYFDLDRAPGVVRDWNCGTVTYDQHDAVDMGVGGFPGMDQGRDVLAAADGVVTMAHDGEFDRCTTANCGAANYVWIRHADGKATLYYHLRKGSVAVVVGQAVTCGQKIAQVGSSGYSSGPHLHFQTNTDPANISSGDDPFAATSPACGGQTSWWVGQGAYRGMPSYTCENAPPPPPPPCDRSAGPFTFSCDGPQPQMSCVNVNEAADPDSWADNFFCSQRDLGLRWSMAGPLAGMDCTNVIEPSEKYAAVWSDNYLCAPKQALYELSYSNAGPLAGKTCVQLNEPADPDSWADNYVCATARHEFRDGPFTFKADGPKPGAHCVSVNEPADPDTWADNYFCSDMELGMKWSFAGPIAGMACTNVSEAADAQAAAWADNYLCLPEDQPYRFTWSSAGPVAGQSCIRWFDHAETSATWEDNWLCVRPYDVPKPVVDAGVVAPGPDAGVGPPARDAGIAAQDAGQVTPGDGEPAPLPGQDPPASGCGGCSAPGASALVPLALLLVRLSRRRSRR